MSDEMPEQPKTTRLEAVPSWASELATAVRNIALNVGTMNQSLGVLMEDRPVLHSRLAGVEGRLARIETPSIPPPAAITSERVRAITDSYTSKVDLEQQARLADQIVKDAERDAERDRRIEETHAIAIGTAAAVQEQSDFMGMGRKGVKWLMSKDGRTGLAQLAAALVAAYETLKLAGVLK